MIKKIIPLIVLSLCSCKKDDKKGSNGLLNENDTPNAPIKAYIKDLMCKYPNNWPKIFAALKKMQVGKLLSSDQQILINNQLDIERDLGKTPNLLNYFYQLTKTSSLDQAKNPDTRNFTTEQARIRRELYDLMSNIASEIFSYDNTPILLDFQALLVMCFSDQKGQEEFFNNREDIKNVFKKTTTGEAKETFNYKKFPPVFDLKLVKGNIDDKKKKEILENIIWENLIQIIKNNVKVITFAEADNKGMQELKGIKKDRFIYDTKKCLFPLTSATEVAIMETCQMFGINYNESFSKVETKHNTEEIKNFCLAFSTYVLKKFGCKFGADKKLKCENECGLLSSHHPLCFLSHQVLGIVWAIINTSLEKVEKIDTTIDFVLDLSGTFECDMKETEIREAVRNSLFGGTGFYAQDGSINEWHTPFTLQTEDFKGMNGYATLDYRYIINFLFYQCFGAGINANALLDIKNAAWENCQAPDPNHNAKNSIFNDIISHEGKTTDFALATFSILNAMSTKDGRSGGMYLFCGCDDSQHLIGCINNATDDSKTLSEKVCQQCTTTKWQQIIDREGKSDLYSAFLTNMLIPLWNEFVTRNNDDENQYTIKNQYKIEDTTDPAKIRDFYFRMLYRTYEALGTYCLLDAIYKKNSVTWKIYNN